MPRHGGHTDAQCRRGQHVTRDRVVDPARNVWVFRDAPVVRIMRYRGYVRGLKCLHCGVEFTPRGRKE